MAKKKKDPFYIDYAEQLAEHYEIAIAFSEADTYLNTNELLVFMQGIIPGEEFLAQTLTASLREYGYRTDVIDGEVMWLLRSI